MIATDVGNCRGLIYGEGDDLGAAGILTHIMNVEEITAAIRDLAASSKLRKTMGECGYARLKKGYQLGQMIETYQELYKEIGWEYGKLWPGEEDEDGYGKDFVQPEMDGYGEESVGPEADGYGEKTADFDEEAFSLEDFTAAGVGGEDYDIEDLDMDDYDIKNL